MRITKYTTFLNDEGHAYLCKEKSTNIPWLSSLQEPKNIASMMCDAFQADKWTEEYVYLLCFNTKMQPLGMFEVSHGTVDCSIANPREVFAKALLCNASRIIVVHNHPSGEPFPSAGDSLVCKRLKESGEMLGMPMLDFIVIGKERYFSFAEEKML